MKGGKGGRGERTTRTQHFFCWRGVGRGRNSKVGDKEFSRGEGFGGGMERAEERRDGRWGVGRDDFVCVWGGEVRGYLGEREKRRDEEPPLK